MRTEFEKWWFKTTHPWTEFSKDPMEIARISFEAGLGQAASQPAEEIIHIARQNERDAIEHTLLAMAGAAFIAGRDDHAHWFRSLVNTLFKKPGETSA